MNFQATGQRHTLSLAAIVICILPLHAAEVDPHAHHRMPVDTNYGFQLKAHLAPPQDAEGRLYQASRVAGDALYLAYDSADCTQSGIEQWSLEAALEHETALQSHILLPSSRAIDALDIAILDGVPTLRVRTSDCEPSLSNPMDHAGHDMTAMAPSKDEPSAMDHSAMDHSTMDHSTMDHSTMDHSTMDHSTMDHSTMDHSTMDHSTMDHSTMDHSTMDHSTMDHSTMDHSTMDHSTMDHSTMDHSTMDQADPDMKVKAEHDKTTMTHAPQDMSSASPTAEPQAQIDGRELQAEVLYFDISVPTAPRVLATMAEWPETAAVEGAYRMDIGNGTDSQFGGAHYARVLNNQNTAADIPSQQLGLVPTITVQPDQELAWYAPAVAVEGGHGLDPDSLRPRLLRDPLTRDVVPDENRGPRMFVAWGTLGLRALEHRLGHYHTNAKGEGLYAWNMHEIARFIDRDNGSDFSDVALASYLPDPSTRATQIIVAVDRHSGLWLFTFKCENKLSATGDSSGVLYCDPN